MQRYPKSQSDCLVGAQSLEPDFVDEGWFPHKNIVGLYPCIVGWEQKSKVPKDPRGYDKASRLAISRWEQDYWASGIRFHEDIARVWKLDGSDSRTISPSECERLLGSRFHGQTQEQQRPMKIRHSSEEPQLGNNNVLAVPKKGWTAFGRQKETQQKE